MVSWRPPTGKRQRRFFAGKPQAEACQQDLAAQKDSAGAGWLGLSPDQRNDIALLVAEGNRGGFTLREAVEFYLRHQDSGRMASTLGEAFDRFMAEKQALRLSPKTLAAFRSTVGRFVSGREQAALGSIRMEDLQTWLQRPAWSPRTFNSYLTSLATFFRWAVAAHLPLKSPAISLRKIGFRQMPDIDEAPAVLSVTQCESMMAATMRMDPGLVPYVAVCLFGGLRPEPRMRLTPPDPEELARTVPPATTAPIPTENNGFPQERAPWWYQEELAVGCGPQQALGADPPVLPPTGAARCLVKEPYVLRGQTPSEQPTPPPALVIDTEPRAERLRQARGYRVEPWSRAADRRTAQGKRLRLAPERARSQPSQALEDRREMLVGGEPSIKGNPGDGKVGRAEHVFCVLDAAPLQILDGRHAGFAFEHRFEMGFRHPRYLRELSDCDRLAEIVLDMPDRPSHPSAVRRRLMPLGDGQDVEHEAQQKIPHIGCAQGIVLLSMRAENSLKGRAEHVAFVEVA